MAFHLAELNIARLTHPMDHPENGEFVAVLEAVNQLAEVYDGFVWRLKDDDGRSASYVEAFDDPQLIINLTVWTDAEALRHFVYRSGHGAYFRRRSEWFDPDTSEMVCWWIPAGTTPTVEEGIEKLRHLRSNGSTDAAFPFSDVRPTPDATDH
jgi:hypothetical protein